VFARLRLALLVLLGLGLREQILEGVLHLAHQAGAFGGVLGVLLAILLLVVLTGFAVALLALLAVFTVLARSAFALRIGIVSRHFVVGLLARFLAGERLRVHFGDAFGLGFGALSFLVRLLLAG